MFALLSIIVAIVIIQFMANKNLKKNNSKLIEENQKLKKQLSRLQDSQAYVNKTETSKSTDTAIQNNDSASDDLDIPIKVNFSVSHNGQEISDKDLEEENQVYETFNKLWETSPKAENFYGRGFNYPKYTDSYKTNTDFTLRQLLLLVWLGKVKKGRLVTARIPKYFIEEYDLNAQKTIQLFLDEGLLSIQDDRYQLSKEAKSMVSFYKTLWDLHSIKNFPICLDEDFPKWNNGKLLISFYKEEIEFLKAEINFNNKVIWFYDTYPSLSYDEQHQKRTIESYKQNNIYNQNDIKKDEAKIKALNF